MLPYLAGTVCLGASVEFGPLSPEQLSKVDRLLTPEEQKAVSDWQIAQADKELAAERAKGGPRSETISVTPQGAIIRAQIEPEKSANWWKWIGIGAAVLVLGIAVTKLEDAGRVRRHA